MNIKKAIIIALATVVSWTSFGKVVVENKDLWANVPEPLKAARWVWPNPAAFAEIANTYAQFRKTFDLKEVPQKAPLYITADQCYRLYINGEYVAQGPARGFQKSQPFDEIDAAKYLKKGKNVIAVRGYNVGRSTFGYLTQGVAGVIFALDLGNGNIVKSDGKVQCRRQSGCDRNTACYSLQMNNQEHIDLRVENPDWIRIDFDDSKWGGSENRGSTVFNAMPYYQFESRMIPMLESYILPSPKLVAAGKGESVNSDERVFNVNALLAEEKYEHKAASSSESFIKVPASKEGEFQSYVFDFGKMVIGMPMMSVEGAQGGEIVDMSFCEVLKDNFVPYTLYGTHSQVSLGNRMICRAGNQTHDFFHLQGFRYVVVRVRNNSSDIKISPMLRWVAYPLADKGKLSTSDADVNKIWQACRQTQKICSIDSYVDTPMREQAQWWGDARVQSWNTFFLSNDARLLRRGIHIIGMQTAPNGLTYGHAPTMAHSCILPDFALTWIETLWDYYWQTGKIDAYLENKEVIDGILSYFESNKNENGLVRYDPRYWLFMDWTDIQREGVPTLLNMLLLHSLDKLTRMCEENGLADDAAKFREQAAKIRSAIEGNLVDVDGLVIDGYLPNGKKSSSKSIHVQTLARINNIKGFNFKKAVDEIILPYLKEDKLTSSKADPSSFWIVHNLKVMVDEGYNREVYDYIKRRWGEMADYGTTFENFKVSDGISHSHAWSAHPLFLLPQILGGVRQEGAGWSKISCKPNHFVDSAEIVWPTPRGDIKISWQKKSDGSFDEKIEMPK